MSEWSGLVKMRCCGLRGNDIKRSQNMNLDIKMAVQRIAIGCLLAGSLVWASAQDATPGQAPDNTKVNQHDKPATEPTADQQKDSRSDLEITKEIRRSIMSEKSLSTYAHNIKIISQNGMVTLKG